MIRRATKTNYPRKGPILMASAPRSTSGMTIDGRFLSVAGLLAIAFLFGGGSRADIASLPLLRTIFGFAFVFAAWKFALPTWRSHPALAGLAAGIMLLPLLQLVPLPPAVWTALPGRQIVVDVFTASKTPLPWLPLSLAPVATLNSLMATFIPITMMLLVLTSPQPVRQLLLRMALVVGLVSGLLGLLQAIGSADSPLYFYRITNDGSAVGLFANRNHQAIFLACLFPLLAAHLSMASGRSEMVRLQKIATLATGVFLLPLILVTGSRSGLLLILIAVPLALWLYRAPKVVGRNIVLSGSGQLSMVIIGVVATALIALLLFASFRAPAVMRLLEEDAAGDLRWQALPTLLRAGTDMLPFGSGLGSFADVYKFYEPSELLSAKYFNQAHNDYVEIFMTAGLPGLALIAFALWILFSGLRRVVFPSSQLSKMPEELILARAGAAVLVLLAIASVGDYPLRTPSIAAFAAIAVSWLAGSQARALRT
jgi:O-antigen ligase